MRRMPKPWFIALLALIAVGIVVTIVRNPGSLIIPAAVFAVVFLLYKFPPAGLRGARPRTRSAAQPAHQRVRTKPRTRKNAPFRVIEGGKDDDNLPKYH